MTSGGFTLTNNPTAVNSNVYSGTYIDHNPPGTGEQYKFVINTNGGGTAYESPVSTGGQNRAFVLADTDGGAGTEDRWPSMTVNRIPESKYRAGGSPASLSDSVTRGMPVARASTALAPVAVE